MRIRISHRTTYRYAAAPAFSAQLLRLTPRTGPGQSVLDWSIASSGRLSAWTDAFGNACSLLVFDRPSDRIAITAAGEVMTADLRGATPAAANDLPLEAFLRQSARTSPDAAIIEFAAGAGARLAAGRRDGLHRLMSDIRERVLYRVGVTDAHSTAAESFAAGHGVCQDHAHIFIGCARRAGIPARYVSGYLHDGDHPGPLEAGHAWAEAWIDGTGWVGFDVSNGMPSSERHVVAAVGLDYDSASPVRGMRAGDAADETLEVSVSIEAV